MAAPLASDLIGDAQQTYGDLTDARGLIALKEVDKMVQRTFRYRQKWIYAAAEAYEEGIDLDARAMWVREVRWVNKPNPQPNKGRPGVKLDLTTEETIDTAAGDLAKVTPGTPVEAYRTSDLTGGEIGLKPAPRESTLTVSDATNATPIVVTSSAAHGLSDGDRVDVREVLGNLAANGEFYAKRTGFSTTTFGLYSDEDLTTAVAGSGAYTSGGIIGCAGSPYLAMKVAWHDSGLVAGSSMPDVAMYRNLYVDGIKWHYAKEKHKKDVPDLKPLFEDILAEQDRLNRQVGYQERRFKLVEQRPCTQVRQTRF